MQPARRSEWIHVARSGPTHEICSSRFLTEGLEVFESFVREKWRTWGFGEQLEFAQAFATKPRFTLEDQAILKFLIDAGSEYVWATIAPRLSDYSDREAALQFLMERIRTRKPSAANYFQALELMGDPRSVPLLRARYEEFRGQLARLQQEDLSSDLVDYHACCLALWKLDGSEAYQRAFEELLNHQDEDVRSLAQRSLAERELQSFAEVPLGGWQATDPPQLLRETQWSRLYRAGAKRCIYVSKFATDSLTAAEADVRGWWGNWSLAQQVEFAEAFVGKPRFTDEKMKLFRFLLEAGSEYVRLTTAMHLSGHSARTFVVGFLLGQHWPEGSAGRLFVALQWIGDPRAIPHLRQRYEQYRGRLAPFERHGRDRLEPYLRCCRALYALEGDAGYLAAIRELSVHPQEAVRRLARKLTPPLAR